MSPKSYENTESVVNFNSQQEDPKLINYSQQKNNYINPKYVEHLAKQFSNAKCDDSSISYQQIGYISSDTGLIIFICNNEKITLEQLLLSSEEIPNPYSQKNLLKKADPCINVEVTDLPLDTPVISLIPCTSNNHAFDGMYLFINLNNNKVYNISSQCGFVKLNDFHPLYSDFNIF